MRWIDAGLSKNYASFMTELDRRIREEGTEAQVTDTVWRVTGKSPISFTQFVQYHANVWKK